MIYLPIYLLSFLWVVPAVRMWRRDSELFNACIAEVRAARVDQREFPAYDAWRKHTRRSVVLIVVVLVVTTVQIMVVGSWMVMNVRGGVVVPSEGGWLRLDEDVVPPFWWQKGGAQKPPRSSGRAGHAHALALAAQPSAARIVDGPAQLPAEAPWWSSPAAYSAWGRWPSAARNGQSYAARVEAVRGRVPYSGCWR